MSQAKTTAQSNFPPIVLNLIRQAQMLNKISIYLIYLAIIAFLIFGTLKSLPAFQQSELMYQLFHFVPYGLIGLSIPLSCYVAFILYRYRLSQPSMLALCIGVGFGLFAISSYVALASWIGVAFMFKVNLKRFFNFIDNQIAPNR